MGWSYESRIAYGITINTWKHHGVKELLGHYKSVLGYDAKMSLEGDGTLFVYLKSSYKILWEDNGSYSFRSPDTTGDSFNPPDHPIIHKVDAEIVRPKRTPDEIIALNKIRKFCDVNERGVWMRHSYISY